MRKNINVNILEVRDGHLYLAGSILNFRGKRESIYIADENGQKMDLQPFRAPTYDREATEDKKARRGFAYQVSLPLHLGAYYRFFCRDAGKSGSTGQSGHDAEVGALSPRFRRHSQLVNLENSFFIHKDFLISTDGDGIRVDANRLTTRHGMNKRWQKTLQQEAPAEVISMREKAIRLKKQSKPIWLLSDRTDAAGDNGEAFFEYLMKTGAPEKYDLYFLIDPSSPDYERIQSIGPVLPVGSEEHKAAFLAASVIISSAADNWFIDPFGADRIWYQDLVDHPFVFLQHGVIKDDLSDWLYFLKKNIRIFITSSPGEWDSIAHGPYGYDESIVKLTGLARYDKLYNDPKPVIAILPTWRKSAAADRDPGTSGRPYSEDFKDTDYCRFYNRLINDPRLLQALEETGYTGTFYLHPNHRNQWPDFQGNEFISVWKELIPFSQVFRESSLMVTDYSSVAIDFAYLGKPVVYAQWDRDAFFASHSYVPGYYDYKKDGFGPVCDTYEETVEAIIGYLKQNCRQSELYRRRGDQFFSYRDQNNCKRILEEILKLQRF